jgi:hypothetical protein
LATGKLCANALRTDPLEQPLGGRGDCDERRSAVMWIFPPTDEAGLLGVADDPENHGRTHPGPAR